jgi:GDP-L-fucose synthase
MSVTTTTRRIFVAGHRGMVGAALCRRLSLDSSVELVTAARNELDLTNADAVDQFFKDQSLDAVIFAAARVGGIVANDRYPVQFLTDNIRMAVNAITAAYENQVPRFLFLGSTCVYPRDCAQPIAEPSLLSGPLEQTNEAYAIAKIAGVKLCQYYRRQYGVNYTSAMPTNLYGPGDNYHPENSHVLPGLIRRFHEAALRGDQTVSIWGSGKPRREFLHVDDLADALVHLLDIVDLDDWVNVGTGRDLSIMELAHLVAEVVGFKGAIETDSSRPDGTPIKCTDVSRLSKTGWTAKIDLADGLKQTFQCYLNETQQGLLRAV